MADFKKSLKASKAALDAGKFDEAVSEARKVLAADSSNYFGNVFLGRSLEKQGKLDEAASAYQDASKLKPDDELAWKGLCQVYESQGSLSVNKYNSAALNLAQVFAKRDDQDQCQTIIDELVAFAKVNGTRSEYKKALEALLPSSPVFDFLEGRLPRPSFTYIKLAEITESEEIENINKQIGERRTRLGASLGSVTSSVTREIYSNSTLEDLYRNIIDWTTDDDERRNYEEKLLQRAYDTLCVLLPEEKPQKRDYVTKLAHDMVIIQHPFALAWHLELEFLDIEDLAQHDKGLLEQYIGFFPDSGLSKALQAYLGFDYQRSQSGQDGEIDSEKRIIRYVLNAEEKLTFFAEGLENDKKSTLCHRLAANFYFYLEEYESAVETARKALSLLQVERNKTGVRLPRVTDAINTTLATSMIYYQSPKNHPEAHLIFNEILKRRPEATGSLLGVGLILEEQARFDDAYDFLSRAAAREPDDVKIASEAAWCEAMLGRLSSGLEKLTHINTALVEADPSKRELRGQISYRIGTCLWDLHQDRKSRKDRRGAYAYFVSSIKLNPSFSSAYTSLGLYYENYARDRKRARLCFQKAFELSSSELTAAEYLARSFADDREWDLVELIAERATDSGLLRPAPGSKKKGISWPFVALGIVYMNKQEYSRSVNFFQSALRISPNHYQSWVGLGESYHSSGRYNAALQSLEHALALNKTYSTPEEDWFARYMLANVYRELGEFEKALESYREVLSERSQEYGVTMALLQTIVELSQHLYQTGLFSEAVEYARTALITANDSSEELLHALNFWRAVGDASIMFINVPESVDQFPVEVVRSLLQKVSEDGHDPFSFDRISVLELEHDKMLISIVGSTVIAFKQALRLSETDIHAQAIAWYNLGWAEFRASLLFKATTISGTRTSHQRLSKAAVRCFKRANELEAGNGDFWNALGVVTTEMNPKVAQHSLVRSLYINERSSRAWTNLGALYLLHQDVELAHESFSRAQSIDPEYALAWLGEGVVALLFGDQKEALSHFKHAAEIADTSTTIIERQYVVSTFDLIIEAGPSHSLADLVRPLLALQRIQSRTIDKTKTKHLMGLFLERLHDYGDAIISLNAASAEFETQYEADESSEALNSFLKVKADLSRCLLASQRYIEAIETSQTVLDLSTDDDATAINEEERRNVRLSAHLVGGLAYYFTDEMQDSVNMFRSALEEDPTSTSVICLLAQVLWARANEKEKFVAKEQLFDCVEKNEDQVMAMLLLGAMSFIDGDKATRDAVLDDLQKYRARPAASDNQSHNIDALMVALDLEDMGESSQDIKPSVLTSIMLNPSQSHVWRNLVDQSEDELAAFMTLELAEQTGQSNEGANPPEIARAYASVGSIADVQRAICLDPWSSETWNSFKSSVA